MNEDKNYSEISNRHLVDTGLSLSAKGLLSLMLAAPSEWNRTGAGLPDVCKEGADEIQDVLDELETRGYIRQCGENGYIVYQTPEEAKE